MAPIFLKGVCPPIARREEEMLFVTRLVAKASKTDGRLRVNEDQRQHYERFRKVSIHYPRYVLEAYRGDFRRAMGHDDEQVAVTIAAWQRQQRIGEWRAAGGAKRTEKRRSGAWDACHDPTRVEETEHPPVGVRPSGRRAAGPRRDGGETYCEAPVNRIVSSPDRTDRPGGGTGKRIRLV
jgi:hypothetical protein